MIPDYISDFLNQSPNWLAFLAAALMFAFTTLYFALFNWRLTATSRAFAHFCLSLTSVLILSVAVVLLGPHYPFRWVFRDIVLLWIIYGVGGLLVNLFRKWDSPGPVVLEPRPKRNLKDRK